MMKKFLKFAGIAIGIFFLLLIGALFALKKMFPPEKIKQMVMEQTSQKLHREVKLGDVDIGVFSGISLKDFALSESPGFKNGTFVESKRFVLKFELLPLLRKKVVIHELGLEAPQIRIVQKPDGKTFNFSDLIAPSTAPPAPSPTAAAPSAPISLTVSKAKISDGKVEFIDQSPRKMKVILDPINLSVSATALDKPMALDLNVGVDAVVQNKKIKGDLRTKSVADLKTMRVEFESLQWKMAALVLDVKGKVENFIKPKLDLSLSIHDVNLQALSPWIALPKEVTLTGSPQFGFDVKGTLDRLNASVSFDLTKMELGYSTFFHKPADTPLTLSAAGILKNQKDLTLDSLKFVLSGIEASVKGEIQNLTSANPPLRLEVHSNSFDIKELSKVSSVANNYNASGRLALNINVSGALKTMKITGGLDLDNLTAKVEKINAQSLSGKVKFTDNSLDIPQLTGKLGPSGGTPSDFQVKASVRDFKKPDVSLEANFSVLDLGMFISDKKKEEPKKEASAEEKKSAAADTGPEIKADGKVTIGKVVYTKFEGQKAEAVWKLTGITPSLTRLNGTAQFEMKDGKIHQIPLLATLAPILKIDPSALVYSRMGGHLNITQGTAKTEDFQIASQAADLFAKGTIYLPTNKPDLLLTARLPKGSIGGAVGEFANDAEGRPTFVFKMKNDWKPTLDAGQIQKKAVEKATEEIKKRATDILQNEGKKLLDGIFK